MSTASDVLSYCKSQIGIKESPKNSNNVKYNTAYYGHNVSGSQYAWCSTFLWYCFNKTAKGLYPKNANAAYAQDEVVSKCGGKWIMKKTNSSTTRKAYLKKAKPGDIVCFDFGAYSCYRQHVGIILSVEGDHFVTIEGNTSANGSQSNGGMVCKKTRRYSDICSAARPNFQPAPKKHYTGELPSATVSSKTGTVANIKRWQKFLNWWGASLSVDGDFGSATEKATKKFQSKYELEADGIVGAKTRKQAKFVASNEVH